MKVLGCFVRIDEGEADYKLIVIDVNDPLAEQLNDLEDVKRLRPFVLYCIRNWLETRYKVTDPKLPNQLPFNGEPKGRDFALKVARQYHEQWKELSNTDPSENQTGLDLRNTTILGSPNLLKPLVQCDSDEMESKFSFLNFFKRLKLF